MTRNPIALAIPFFFLCIGVELVLARVLRRSIYRLNDAYADLGCGIAQQSLGMLYGWVLVAAHTSFHERFGLLELRSPLAWVLALLGVDFCYYWWHRASHRVNALWAAHVVHHQSEDMNLAVALRQAPLTGFTGLPFYLPLTLVFPPLLVFVSSSINTLYQFWIHTDLIPKLGPIEWIFNTPSHHRAHHGINPRYIDKNYAGILIVWDRLFGTFAEETEPVVYGTTDPLRSFDPVWAQVQPWVRLARRAIAAPGLDKVRLFFAPPEWAPAGAPPHVAKPVTPETRPKWDVSSPALVRWYVRFWLAWLVAATFSLLWCRSSLETNQVALAVGGILVTLVAGAALLEGKRWAWPFEAARLVALIAVAFIIV